MQAGELTATVLNTPKGYALSYHDMDLSVFVLRNPEKGTELQLKDRKRPAVNWDLYQIMRPSKIQIERWFSKNPNYNVAIVTGSISKIVAFDVDGPTANKRVEEQRVKMSTNLRVALDNTMMNKTGSGGTHIIFRLEEPIDDISQETLWEDGQEHSEIKLQGDGHYIVAAPSVHPNGNEYQWNGKTPHLVTRQELDELIRLVSTPGLLQSRRQSVNVAQRTISTTTTTDRTLTPEKMHKLVELVKPYYTPGTREILKPRE